jgi:hypothetical protein
MLIKQFQIFVEHVMYLGICLTAASLKLKKLFSLFSLCTEIWNILGEGFVLH